jgi:hypothetical protein
LIQVNAAAQHAGYATRILRHTNLRAPRRQALLRDALASTG